MMINNYNDLHTTQAIGGFFRTYATQWLSFAFFKDSTCRSFNQQFYFKGSFNNYLAVRETTVKTKVVNSKPLSYTISGNVITPNDPRHEDVKTILAIQCPHMEGTVLDLTEKRSLKNR